MPQQQNPSPPGAESCSIREFLGNSGGLREGGMGWGRPCVSHVPAGWLSQSWRGVEGAQGALWEVMWDVAGPQQDLTLGKGLQGSSRAVTRASQVCPWTVSALSLFSRTASDVLIFSFFHCRKKSGPGMRTKCSSCTIPSTGEAAE